MNTESKQLAADFNKVCARMRKLVRHNRSERRKLERLHSMQLKAQTRQHAAEMKQLESSATAIEKRLNLVLGRAGK